MTVDTGVQWHEAYAAVRAQCAFADIWTVSVVRLLSSCMLTVITRIHLL